MTISLLGSFLNTLTGWMLAIVICGLLFSGIFAGIEAFAFTAHWIVTHRYRKNNKIKSQVGYTGAQAARTFLDMNELQDVKVQQAGFWRAFFIGNSYSSKKNTIFLRKNIFNESSITADAIALQKVAIVIADKQGHKGTRLRNRLQAWIPFVPYLFIPIILVGVILDSLIFGWSEMNGIATIVAGLIAVTLLIVIFAFAIIVAKVEKRANTNALMLMEKTNFLTAEERVKVKSLFNAYIVAYVADILLAVFQILKIFFKILGKSTKIVIRKQ